MFEQVMTDTALYADVVLPATTFLEGYDFAKGYGPINLDLVLPVVDVVGESRTNADVFGELCARLGRHGAEPAGEPTCSSACSFAPGRSATTLRAGAPGAGFGTGARAIRRRVSEHARPQGRSVSRGARIERAGGPLSFQPDPATDRYPLSAHLCRPASERSARRSASCRGPTSSSCIPTMRRRGLGDSDLVRVFNDLGEVHCTLSISASVRPGMVSLPKGLWRRGTRNGYTGTALVPDTLTDLGGGACFNDARVQVASLPTA